MKFTSRNNDVDGYWALGVFYRLCVNHDVRVFTLDFLSGASSPEANFSTDVATPFRDFLYTQIRNNGLAETQLTAAFAEVEFDLQPTAMELRLREVWGDPFICRIVLDDDLGRRRTCSKRGCCWAHDPAREQRSTRSRTVRGPFS